MHFAAPFFPFFVGFLDSKSLTKSATVLDCCFEEVHKLPRRGKGMHIDRPDIEDFRRSRASREASCERAYNP